MTALILCFGAGSAPARAAVMPELPFSPVPSGLPLGAPYAASIAAPLNASFAAPASAPALEAAWFTGAALAAKSRDEASRSSGSQAAARASDGVSPLFNDGLWSSLKAPDEAALDVLAQRIPRLKRDAVRELPIDAVDALLQQAIAAKNNALDVFTDPGLRQRGQLFYMSEDTLKEVAARYKLYILNPFSGKAKDGGRYACQGIVMGGGKIEMLYDADEFEFDNPDYKGHSYKGSSRITETIQGPGDLKVEGLSVAMFMHPRIQRFLMISEGTLRVETNWANEEVLLKPIAARRSSRP